MKTFDGAKLVADRLARALATYPAGSVTPRTVVATLQSGTDPEATFQKVDAAITTQLTALAATVHDDPTKLRRVSLSDNEIEQMTTIVVKAANSLSEE